MEFQIGEKVFEKDKFLRDLPELPFWESDYVRVLDGPRTGEIYQVIDIDYNYMNDTRNDGSKYPIYKVSDKMNWGWHTSYNEDELELVKRGEVWKYFHNETIDFENLEHEANFFVSLGHYEEVRNPNNNLYCWTKEEVLEAIKNGIVHGFSLSSMFGSISIIAKKFNDEELGKRVAKATLNGFNI